MSQYSCKGTITFKKEAPDYSPELREIFGDGLAIDWPNVNVHTFTFLDEMERFLLIHCKELEYLNLYIHAEYGGAGFFYRLTEGDILFSEGKLEYVNMYVRDEYGNAGDILFSQAIVIPSETWNSLTQSLIQLEVHRLVMNFTGDELVQKLSNHIRNLLGL